MLLSYMITLIPLIVIFAIMPYLTRKDNFFGISAPEYFYKEKAAKNMRMAYTAVILAVGVMIVAAAFVFGGRFGEYFAMILTFTLIFVYGAVYYIMHIKAKNIKKSLGWSEGAKNYAVTDTSFFSKKIAVSKLWFVAYALVIAATVAIGFYFYDSMPSQVAVHTDINGQVSYAQKSIKTILMMPLTQVFIATVFVFIYYSFKKARPEISAGDVEGSAERSIKHRYAWSCFAVFAGLGMLVLFLVIQAELVGLATGISLYATMAVIFTMIAATVVLSVILGQSGSRLKRANGGQGQEALGRDDDSYWKMGMFYVNKNDPSVFVEKRFGIGYTVNFARPAAWLLLAVVITIVVISIILSK